MITLSASGGSVTFEFSGNSTYLNDGQITVPVNSLALIIDESDMATFRKAASNDIFVSANIAEFGMTKDELMAWYKANMVGATGGGSGSGVTPSEVQTMIDESISGKADNEGIASSSQTYVVETPPYGSPSSIVNTLDNSYGGLRVYKVDNYSTCYLIGYDENDTEIGRITFSSENPTLVDTTGFTDVIINRERISDSASTAIVEGKELTAIKKFSFYNNYWATDEETSVYFYNKAYNVTDAVRFDFAKKADGINATWGPWPELYITLTSGERTITGVAAYFDSKYFRSYYDQYDNHLLSIKESVFQDYAKTSAVTEEISAAVSGKVNVSDNIVSAHTFNARSADGGTYYTKLKFDGRHFSFNDFHSKKISVYPFGGLNGQLFTSLYLNSYNYVSYDAAAYLSGSTNDDYPSSFTSVTWTGDETKMKVEINSEGYLDLIAQGDYWFSQINSNVTHELYVNILNDIASGQSASVINDSIVNNLENLGNTINGIQYEINGKLDASAYTPINVDSTLSQTSVNPIQNKSLFNELRVSGASSGDTTIVFVNGESTNYPEGVTVIKFEPTQSNTWASYEFYNGSSYLGNIQVSYYGNISVTLSLDGATYTTSGNTVILTVPSTLGITKIAQLSGDYNNFTVKVENPPIYTPLKNQVVANTTALGGMTIVKITESDYQSLSVKDPDTLYVVIPDTTNP